MAVDMKNAKKELEDLILSHNMGDKLNPKTDKNYTAEDLLKALNKFPNEPTVDAAEGKLYVTSALVRSETGDSYLILERGIKTEREIALEEFASNPTWWGCFSLMDVSMLETIDA